MRGAECNSVTLAHTIARGGIAFRAFGLYFCTNPLGNYFVETFILKFSSPTKSMAIRIGINGFGRIGRLVLRRAVELEGFDIAGVNDVTDAGTLAHLLKYDSVHGKFPGEIKVNGNTMTVDGDRFAVFSEKDPAKLPWGKLGADIVIESTGKFADRAGCQKHLD